MIRISKSHEEREKEIIETSYRLFLEYGYENTSVQQIMDAVGISKSTFYYYFKSKVDILDALGEFLTGPFIGYLEKLIADPSLNALEKLNSVFSIAGQIKTDNKNLNMLLLKAFYSENNLLVRYRIRKVRIDRFSGPLSKIIEQGVNEGSFNTPDPYESIRIILTLGEEMMEEIVSLLIEMEEKPENRDRILERYRLIESLYERILGAKEGSIRFFDREFLSGLTEKKS